MGNLGIAMASLRRLLASEAAQLDDTKKEDEMDHHRTQHGKGHPHTKSGRLEYQRVAQAKATGNSKRRPRAVFQACRSLDK